MVLTKNEERDGNMGNAQKGIVVSMAVLVLMIGALGLSMGSFGLSGFDSMVCTIRATGEAKELKKELSKYKIRVDSRGDVYHRAYEKCMKS